MLAKRACMIKNFIYGKTPPAINREKFWRVDSIGKKRCCKLKREASAKQFYLRKDKGNLKGFQTIFATRLS